MADQFLGVLRQWAEHNDKPDQVIAGGPFVYRLASGEVFTIATNRVTLICVRGVLAGAPDPVLDDSVRDHLDRMVGARPEEVTEARGAALRGFLGDPAWSLDAQGPAWRRRGWLAGVPIQANRLAQPLSLLPQVETYRLGAYAIGDVPVVYVYGDGFFVLQAGCDIATLAEGAWDGVPAFGDDLVEAGR